MNRYDQPSPGWTFRSNAYNFIRLTGSGGKRLLIAIRYIVSFESRHGNEQAKTTVRVLGGDGVQVYAVLEDLSVIEKELFG